MAGRRHADREQSDHPGARCAQPRRVADVTGPVLARFSDLPAGTTTASIRLGSMGSAAYPPVSLDTSKATLTFHAGRNSHGRAPAGTGTVPPADWAFADCRTTPFPGVPDPSRVCLKDGFDSAARSTSSSTRRRIRSSWASASPRRATSCRSSATRGRREWDAESGGGAVTHAVALGTSQSGNFIKTFVHLGLQRGSRRADRLGRHLSVHRRAADAAELPVRRAGRRGGALRARQRAGAVVGHVRGHGGAAVGERACSIGAFGREDVSEGHRGVRRDRVLGAAHVAGARRHRRERATSRFPTTSPLLHAGHEPWRRPRRFQMRRRRPTSAASLPQNPNPMADTPAGADRRARGWVVKGTPPPAEPLSDARGRGRSCRRRAPRRVSRRFPGVTFTDDLRQRRARLRLRARRFVYDDMSGVIARQPPRSSR